MIYLTIVFLCNAALFLFLLEDRYKLWTTVSVYAGIYLVSLLGSTILSGLIKDAVSARQAACLFQLLLLFAASLFLSRNNPLQKLDLAALCFSNFVFLSFFVELLLGSMPFPIAGVFAGVFSVLCYLLFSLLTGLVLYRVTRHFSDRNISGFSAGMLILLLLTTVFGLGKLDFLFRVHILAGRLLCVVGLYALMAFACRSLYQASRFRSRVSTEGARARIAELESSCFTDMLAAVQAAENAHKNGTYAMNTIQVMLHDGETQLIPEYINSVTAHMQQQSILGDYEKNPYVNAVLALKSAFCSQNGIQFECNSVTEDCPLKTPELCLAINEILTKACQEALLSDRAERRLRFTAFAAKDATTLEAVYSRKTEEPKEKFSWKGKSLSELFAYLFDDASEQEDEFSLENTEEIVGRYSGGIHISQAHDETILQVSIRY